MPRLGRLRWTDGQLVGVPRLLVGQTVEDVEAVADRLRVAVDAHRCRVLPNPAHTGCRIVWTFGDPLATPFDATVPDAGAGSAGPAPAADGPDGGRRPVAARHPRLDPGRRHAPGPGKASLVWSLIFGLAPASHGPGWSRSTASTSRAGWSSPWAAACSPATPSTPTSPCAARGRRGADDQARAARLAGTSRSHDVPTPAEPFV